MSRGLDFAKIKASISMLEALNFYGVRVSFSRGKWRGKCPLPQHGSQHKSDSSFKVEERPTGWAWSCHSTPCMAARNDTNRKGGLKAGGNVLDFIKFMERRPSIYEAALLLNERYILNASTMATTTAPPIKTATPVPPPPKQSTPRESKSEPYKPIVWTYKPEHLNPTHPYLKLRGLKAETIEYFGIAAYTGPAATNQNRIVIPIHDHAGKLWGYAGRAIDKSTEPKYLFPAGFPKGDILFNLHRVGETADRIVVCEGFFSCMKIHQAGFPNVVALMGSALTDTQAALLHGFQYVTLMCDGDEAGRRANETIAALLVKTRYVRVIQLEDGQQPDSLSSEAIRKLICP